MQHRIGVMILATVAVMMMGCGAKPPVPPPSTRVAVTLVAASDMNPDVTGRPSPVLLRLYELKAPANFDQADFFSLYQQAQDVLGADLLARDEFLLRPGETRTLERVVEPDARYLGLLAAYRDLDHALWHAVIPLTPHARSQVRVDLGRLALTVHGPSK